MARPGNVSVGQILGATLEVVSTNRPSFGIYLAIFIPLTALGNWLDGDTAANNAGLLGAAFANGLVGMVLLLPSVIGQYLLFNRALNAPGFSAIGAARFVGLALLSYLGVMGATLVLIVPGLFVAARWLLAPAFFTMDGLGVIASLAESWRTVRGSTGKVAAALLIILLALLIVSSAFGALQRLGPPFLGNIAQAVWSEAFAVILVALAAGTYTLLAAPRNELAEVFA